MSMRLENIQLIMSAIDDDLIGDGIYDSEYELVVGGSTSLFVLDAVVNERKTEDIDCYYASDELYPYLYSYPINFDVNTYLYKTPDGWRERLVDLTLDFELEAYHLYTVSLEDMLAIKIVSGRSEDYKDVLDAMNTADIDFSLFKDIMEDPYTFQANCDSEEWEKAERCYWRHIKGTFVI